jgi:hypothetical protein
VEDELRVALKGKWVVNIMDATLISMEMNCEV